MKNISHSRHTGFTLLELLIVIALIMILATLTIGGFSWVKKHSANEKTRVLIASISNALEDYLTDGNALPEGNGDASSSSAVYEVLYGDSTHQSSDEATAYLPSLNPDLTGKQKNVKASGSSYVIVDAWNNPLHYLSPASTNPSDSFDLWSLGADKEGGPQSSDKTKTADDLSNW